MYNQPIAMQLVGRRYEEEKVLGGMQSLSNILKNYPEIKDEAYFNIIEPAGHYDERGYQPRKPHQDELHIGEVSSMPRRDNPIEPYANSLPSAPLAGMPVEQPEYSSETDGSERLSTIPEVSSCSVSDANSGEEWLARTVTPSGCSTNSFVTAGSAPKN